MQSPLKILHLEDDPYDAELAEELLRSEGIETEVLRVDNREEFSAAIEAGQFDLILADNSMPGFNGLSALSLAHERIPEVPFIFLSGTLGEEIAIESLKSGAMDYVLKQRLARLTPVVRRALKQAEERSKLQTAEEALRLSEKRFRALIENAPDGITLLGADGILKFVSPSTERILGYSPEEAVGGNPADLTHPDDLATIGELLQDLVQQPGKSLNAHYRMRHSDGSWRWIESAITNLLDEPGVGAIVFNYRDITESKQAEEALSESERQMRALVTSLDDIVFEFDEQGTYLNIWTGNEGFLLLPRAELIGRRIEEVQGRDFASQFVKVFKRVLQTGQPENVEYPLDVIDGQRWFMARISPIVSLDSPARTVCMLVRDISERKLAEEEIRQRAAQQSALNAIIGAASQAGTSLKELLEVTLDHTLLALGLEMGMIWTDGGGYAIRDLPPEFPLVIQKIALEQNFIIDVTRATPDWREVPGDDPQASIAELMAKTGIQADIVTPLWRGERTIGGLSIMSSKPRQWSESENALVEAIGRQIGNAAERARLLEETQRRLAELEAVNRISTAMRAANTLDELLEGLVDEMLAVLGTDAGCIWLYESDNDLLIRELARGWFAEITEKPLKPGSGIAGTVFVSGEAHASPELAEDPIAYESEPEQIPSGWSGVCVPIHTAQAIVGVLFVSVPVPRVLTPEETELMTTLAEIAGNAIHRMRLYAQTETRLEHLSALREIDMAISSSLDLHFTLNVILDQVTTQLHVDAACILMLNEFAHRLEYTAGRGFRTRAIEGSNLSLGEGLAGRAALDRLTLGVPDRVGERRDFMRHSLLDVERFVAYYAVPLIVKGQVKGVLEVFNRTPINPDQEWLDFLDALAGQTAIAVDNTGLFESLQRSNIELALAYEATIEGWSRALDLRDRETEGHTRRVTELTQHLARVMNIDDEELLHIRRGSILHDIGKMGVPDSILLKPGTLTDEEWIVMRKHPVYAYEMLSPIDYLRPALEIPYCHHEKWDGTGYPRRLKGESIPLAARIFAAADVWDALLSDRPYRAAWPEDKVRAHIREQAGTHFDPKVVEVFLSTVDRKGNGRQP